jgi:hypothetical protein
MPAGSDYLVGSERQKKAFLQLSVEQEKRKQSGVGQRAVG